MRRRGPRPGCRPSALDGHDRLRGRHAPRDPPEAPGVAERLEVEQDELGAGILLPVLEEVVARQIRLVAHRDERGQAHAEAAGRADDRDPEPAALRHEANATRHDVLLRGERRIQPHVGTGVEDAEAIRADEPGPRLAAHLDQLALARGALPPGLGEARGHHQERPRPRRGAVARGGDHPLGGHREDRQIDRAREPLDRPVGAHRLDHVGVLVDRVDRAGEARAQQVAEDLPADRPPLPRGADQRDRSRLEEASHRGHGGDPLALLEAADSLGGERGGELDLERVRNRAVRDREAALAEYVDHPVVVRQHLRDEGRDPLLLGYLGEMGQEGRGDPASLPRVGDEERDLGSVGVDSYVRGMGDDVGGIAGLGDQPEAIEVVDIGRPAGRPVEVGGAEEAERDRFRRQRVQKRADSGAVVRPDRAHAHGRSVAQDDVGLALPRVCSRIGRHRCLPEYTGRIPAPGDEPVVSRRPALRQEES